MSTKPDTHRLYGETLERVRAASDLHEAKRLAAVALVTIPYRDLAGVVPVPPSRAARERDTSPHPSEVNLLMHRLRLMAEAVRDLDTAAKPFEDEYENAQLVALLDALNTYTASVEDVAKDAAAEIERLHRLPGGALHHPERVA